MKKILFKTLINHLPSEDLEELKDLLVEKYKIPKNKFSFNNPKIQDLAISHILNTYSTEEVNNLVSEIRSTNPTLSSQKITNQIKKYIGGIK